MSHAAEHNDNMLFSNDFGDAEHPRWAKWAWAFIAALALFRIIYLALGPFDLVHDEAYYWDWSRQLDYGYYSKPPMIAWIIGLSTRILGHSEFAVRLPAVLLGTGSLALVFLLGRRIYNAKIGFWAMLLTALTPGNVAMSLIMTIDAPFLFFWGAGLYCFWRMLERDQHRWSWVAATAVCIGLGLLTKQTMLAMLVFGGLFVLLSPPDRKEVGRPAVWLAAIGALLFLIPVLVWNQQHDWITLTHTQEHFAAESIPWTERLIDSAEFFGGLIGIISPVTFFLLISTSAAGLLAFHQVGRRERFLLCCGGLPLALVFLLSLKQHLEHNWPAPFFGTGMILAAAWAVGHVRLDKLPFSAGEKRLRHAALVGALCVVLTYALPLVLNQTGGQGSKVDVLVRLRGWDELGEQVDRAVKRHGFNSPVMIVTAGRAVAAELAFYVPDHPQVHLWNDHAEVLSQYDVWGGPESSSLKSIMVVTSNSDDVPPALAGAFGRITKLEQVEVPVGPGRSHRVTLYHGEGFRGWDVAKQLQATQQGRTIKR